MSFRSILLLIVLGGVALVGYNSIYVVTELQRAVLLQFGELVEGNLAPGLHFKKPFINDVVRFDARVLTLDARPERFLTLEKKAVIVDSFAKFKVDDAAKFYTSTSGDETRAESLLSQRINTGLRNEISTRSLHEVVSGERDQLMNILTKALNEVAREELGVEIVDVRVKRIDLPDEVSDSVYERMNTERDIEAREHRAQGQELAAGIRADADKQQSVILAEAYAEAEEIRGEGDAQAAAIYAAAYKKDPEFYKFNRSMQAYATTFADKGDIILVQPDSDFFKYLKNSTQ